MGTTALAGLLVLAACGTARSGQGTMRPPVSLLEAAVVRVELEACQGTHQVEATGVAVDAGLVATVAHSFEDTRSFEVIDNTERRQPADIVWLDAARDLALLRLTSSAPASLPLGRAEDGETIEIITAAMAGEVVTKQATVIQHVTATLDGQGERAAIEIEADIVSGDSGAPLLNRWGEVAGIVFATDRRDDRGWAIAAEEIEAAIAQPKGDPIPLIC